MRIVIDESKWAARRFDPIVPGTQEGFGFLKAGDTYRFILPGQSEVIDVKIVGTELDLQPERSAKHRALIAALK